MPVAVMVSLSHEILILIVGVQLRFSGTITIQNCYEKRVIMFRGEFEHEQIYEYNNVSSIKLFFRLDRQTYRQTDRQRETICSFR